MQMDKRWMQDYALDVLGSFCAHVPCFRLCSCFLRSIQRRSFWRIALGGQGPRVWQNTTKKCRTWGARKDWAMVFRNRRRPQEMNTKICQMTWHGQWPQWCQWDEVFAGGRNMMIGPKVVIWLQASCARDGYRAEGTGVTVIAVLLKHSHGLGTSEGWVPGENQFTAKGTVVVLIKNEFY